MAPKRSNLDWTLEAASLAALLAILGIVTLHWTELPALVPRHFGISGKPDGWGGRNGMLLLPVLAVIIYVVVTLTSRYQRFINVPMSLDRDDPEVKQLLLSMSIVLKLAVLVTFLYLVWASVNTALGNAQGLGKQFFWVNLMVTFLPLGYYLFKLWHYKK